MRAPRANFFCLPLPKEDFVPPPTSLAPNLYIISCPGGGGGKNLSGGGQKFETWHLNTVPSELLLGGSGELKTAPKALHAHFAYSRNNNQIWHIFANSVVLTI